MRLVDDERLSGGSGSARGQGGVVSNGSGGSSKRSSAGTQQTPSASVMEFRSVVFNAARDGKLRRLKVFLDHRPKEEVHQLVSAKTNGATPLVLACRNGHMDVVEYLVERCGANVEQPGSVTFDGETIEGAPPLWCAAAAGHSSIVKLLTERGASVNSTTKTNSTPLRAACFDGHFDIVQFLVEKGADIEVANRHGHTCLMIACYKGHYNIAKYLIEINADVNRKSVKGNTALHDCAESGSLAIMKLLLFNGAKMDVDAYGMTPLLAAAVTGHIHIVEYLISQTSLLEIHRKECINALELLGATYVDKKRDMLGSYKLWKRAMEARYMNGELAIPKEVVSSPISAYENTIEVQTLEELEDIISDPDEMRMQALLVRERILGPAHPDTSYYIRYRGAVYADMGHFERCITLWMYALDMQQKMLEPLSPMTQSSLLSFAELFSFMMSEGRSRNSSNNNNNNNPPVNFCDIVTVFEKAINEVRAGQTLMKKNLQNTEASATTDKISSFSSERDLTYFNRTLVILLHLICLLTKLMPFLNQEEVFKVKQLLFQLLQLDPRGRNNSTPLHLACARDSSSVGRYPICQFPSLDAIRLLIECGADPNATDKDLNTPLHVAASNRPAKPGVVVTLLQGGAHLDSVNHDNKSFEKLLKDQQLHDLVNPLKFTNLQCLAARALKKTKIPYKEILAPNIASFVDLH